ncbi:GNAT family N-acetyltransferase [Deinococcus deserti]|uniref:Putative GCN5-related N-acetyltransferase n=1 Tax=Deinococcus deserti (strain DSM 17065 / CIP 109153 / LMG 22923 / VCD115) TaxID=546414 RepID=C1CXR8_DEIDV|nr:GNAT family N-acetyltransferase [Deinococcus deserti]ACO44874.1 putative GCN5-related N-acetyltransferase [Deinococcus deserti VCD115]
MSLPGKYMLRPATAADADIIAAHRGQMFVDMNELTSQGAEEQLDLWAGWLRSALPQGEYTGILAVYEAQVVGGVGMMVHPKIPSVRDPALFSAYVMNMYVAPPHRRRGLAEALMREMLEVIRSKGMNSVKLHAAPMGRAIYERLGFAESSNPELRLSLGQP